MVSPFETVILRLKDIGAFQFLFPFMLTAAIFYGLIRRSQIFGKPEENVAVNAVVSLIAAFMVWAYPILAGVDIQTQLATFMFQSTSAMLTIIIGLLITSMFFPQDLPAEIGKRLAGGRGIGIVIVAGILIAAGVLVSSGLVKLILPAPGVLPLPEDMLLTIAVLIILMLSVAAIVMTPKGK